MTESSKLQSKI